jgi:hypothetical protein
MKPRPDAQLNLPPQEVRKSESSTAAGESFRNSERIHGSLRFSESDAESSIAFRFSEPLSAPDVSHVVASELLDAALTLAKIENADVERLCEVSASTVHKWRSKNERACPSLAQQLCLPLSFHIALFRVMSRRFGFWRWALSRVAAAVGDLALVAE